MKIKLTEAVTAEQIRQSMSGFVGPKFAKIASDEDIMKMVDLKDKIAKHHNTHILPIQKQIDALYKQYKIKSNKGIEESTSINEVQYKDALTQFNSELKKLSPIKRMATHFNKTVDQVLRAIQPYISVSKFENGDVKQIKIHFTESNSNIMIKHIKNFTKQESVNGIKKGTINEVTVTRIPNFNLESDAYIIMLYLLKNNSGFKKAAINAGIDLFSGANTKTVFTSLQNNLKKVITPQIINAVVQTMNQKRKVLFIDDMDVKKGVHNNRFAGLLALGIIDSFVNDPLDTKLIKDLGNAKLADLASSFSINRGKQKLGVMMGNKGF